MPSIALQFTPEVLQNLAPSPESIGNPAEVLLTWTDDGGHNWAPVVRQSMGALGQTAQRVKFNRIGSTRRNSGLDRVFEVSSEASIQVALIGASLGDG